MNPMPSADDAKHTALVNAFIARCNETHALGVPIDFVASAILAAAATYTAFNLGGSALSFCDQTRMGRQFVRRMEEAKLAFEQAERHE